MFDTVIRGGTILDGSSTERFVGDIAIEGGRIIEVGVVSGSGRREINASDLLVTPGFVDIHTHYDGQVTWDPLLAPSSLHGVTTVVMGNCGVGFAPVSPDRHDWLIGLMEGVEDIPGAVLAEGIAWGWETFPEYLNAIDYPHAINFATQIPHDAVRTYVMGDRGAMHESIATHEELHTMRQIISEAVRAGALGWSTGRTPLHKTVDGLPTPSLTAPAQELVSLAQGLADVGSGVIDIISGFLNDPKEIELIRDIAQASGRPISVSILQEDSDPEGWRRWLERFAEISRHTRTSITGQVPVRAIGVMFGWDLTRHPFVTHPTYREIAHRPISQRLELLRRNEVRAAILREKPDSDDPFLLRMVNSFDRVFRLGDPPDYEPHQEQSIGAQAARMDCEPQELAYDYMLELDGQGLLYFPTLNYAYGDLETVHDMLDRSDTVPALSDGGAHCGTVCDGSFPTTLITHWGRDRTRGERFDLEWLVRRQTVDTASLVGLLDRGCIKPGYLADLNVIDFDELSVEHPKVIYDLPAGGRRLMQGASGYVATLVSGDVVFENGQHSGALPGRLVRGAQSLPVP